MESTLESFRIRDQSHQRARDPTLARTIQIAGTYLLPRSTKSNYSSARCPTQKFLRQAQGKVPKETKATKVTRATPAQWVPLARLATRATRGTRGTRAPLGPLGPLARQV